MSILLIMLNLAGAVALLLWGVRMVRTGVERGYGPALERLLKESRGGRLQRTVLGMTAAMLLQSGSSVAVLAGGFVASGLISSEAGLALALGADLGSSLIVQVLTLDLAWLVPVLFLAGGTMFLKGTSREIRQGGRILVGIGLVLTSLQLIAVATEPLHGSDAFPAAVAYLGNDPASCFLLGAVFTFAVHSSIATILLVASLTAQQVLTIEPAMAVVLGANLGGALIPVSLTRLAAPAARRVAIGNLLFRASLSVIALVLLEPLLNLLEFVRLRPEQELVLAHVAFNLSVVIVFLPLVDVVQPLLRILVRETPNAARRGDLLALRPSNLDRKVLHTPRLALACATRELLLAGEIVQLMLHPLMALFESGTREHVKEIRFLIVEANLVHADIKEYLVELNRGCMTSADAQRSMELVTYSINLHRVGEIVARNLLKQVETIHAERLSFSKDGTRELAKQHKLLMKNLQLALNVLVSGERESARDLISGKERMRDLELRSRDRHLRRLQEGSVPSVETSDIHLAAIRALREVNSLLASVAYPILAESGELLESRLAEAR